jgi:hypothetical protein
VTTQILAWKFTATHLQGKNRTTVDRCDKVSSPDLLSLGYLFDPYDSPCICVWHAQSAAWVWAGVLAIPTPFVPQSVPPRYLRACHPSTSERATGKRLFQSYRSHLFGSVRALKLTRECPALTAYLFHELNNLKMNLFNVLSCIDGGGLSADF